MLGCGAGASDVEAGIEKAAPGWVRPGACQRVTLVFADSWVCSVRDPRGDRRSVVAWWTGDDRRDQGRAAAVGRAGCEVGVGDEPQDHALRCAPAGERARDVDHGGAVAQQRVLDGGADVTEDRARAAGDDRGEEVRSAGGGWVTDRVDPAVKDMESAGGEATLDLPTSQARIEELGEGFLCSLRSSGTIRRRQPAASGATTRPEMSSSSRRSSGANGAATSGANPRTAPLRTATSP